MGYNVDHIEVLKCEGARIKAKDAKRLAKSGDLPECHFLEEIGAPDADGYIAINPDKFWWSGEGSGHAWTDFFIPKVAPKIMGTLEAVVTWEGGDSHSGLRIVDGKVTEPEVIMALAAD